MVGVSGFEGAEEGLEGENEVGSGGEDFVRDKCDIGFGNFECDAEGVAGDRIHWEEIDC